jgi:hypothetical protein
MECTSASECHFKVNSSYSLPSTGSVKFHIKYCNKTFMLYNETDDDMIADLVVTEGPYESVTLTTSQECLCTVTSSELDGCTLTVSESTEETSAVTTTQNSNSTVILLLIIATGIVALATLGATIFLIISAIAKARCKKV